jgi:hypothetical protein
MCGGVEAREADKVWKIYFPSEYSHWFRHQFACLTDTDSHAKPTQHGSSKPTAIRARRHLFASSDSHSHAPTPIRTRRQFALPTPGDIQSLTCSSKWPLADDCYRPEADIRLCINDSVELTEAST